MKINPTPGAGTNIVPPVLLNFALYIIDLYNLYNKILAVAEERHRSIADRRLHMFFSRPKGLKRCAMQFFKCIFTSLTLNYLLIISLFFTKVIF